MLSIIIYPYYLSPSRCLYTFFLSYTARLSYRQICCTFAFLFWGAPVGRVRFGSATVIRSFCPAPLFVFEIVMAFSWCFFFFRISFTWYFKQSRNGELLREGGLRTAMG